MQHSVRKLIRINYGKRLKIFLEDFRKSSNLESGYAAGAYLAL
jgi:hypothetical protein